MEDSRFLIIRDKNGYETIDWSILDEVRTLLDERGYQLQAIMEYEGMCKYCDFVREYVKNNGQIS